MFEQMVAAAETIIRQRSAHARKEGLGEHAALKQPRGEACCKQPFRSRTILIDTVTPEVAGHFCNLRLL